MTNPDTPAGPAPCGLAGATRMLVTSLLVSCMLMSPAWALESDRQQPLEINADSSDGTLGDGRAELRGNVLIRQGTLLIKAEVAEVEKVQGRVREVILTGDPVHLEQEIEQQGRVQATADRIEYSVATGLVTLMGEADVSHPQYRVSGDVLKYDLNVQHFQGSGQQENGRIRIELEPEVIGNREGGKRGGDSQEDESLPPANEENN
ncbi:MAG: lipopolysaccharide transport periplasmic protein LptA [Xanthomonadales bacterium]|nr:lipopolysaccharide transport periplasmic protein LptA [Xanthomonadales bacterium]